MTLLLLACVPPSTIGLRTDGWLEPAGGGEVHLAAGEMLEGIGTKDWPQGPGYGVGGSFSLTDRLAVSASAARYLGLEGVEMELRARVLDEERAPLTLTWLAGGSASGSTDSWGIGAQTGFVGSHALGGDLRPYVGFKVNPVKAQDSVYWFTDASAGATWRPAITPSISGLVLLEATWIHGSGTRVEEGGSEIADMDVAAVIVAAGMSFGKPSGPLPQPPP